LRSVASANEIMPQRVHEVQKPRGAMGIPPCRRKSIEVRDLFWVDGGGAVCAELVLHEPWSASEKEVEVAEGSRAERSSHCAVIIDSIGCFASRPARLGNRDLGADADAEAIRSGEGCLAVSVPCCFSPSVLTSKLFWLP
jgi:hypothetical protein